VLDHTARVALADDVLQEAVTTARSRLLLPLDDDERRAPARLAALAAWGFPQEVVALGERPTLGPFPATATAADLGAPDDPAFLLRLRSLLVDDPPGELALLPGFPAAWAGQPVEVHDLPTAAGRASFAVRWHGERPALLWDVRPLPAAPAAIGTADPGRPVLDPQRAAPDGTAVRPTEPPPDLVLRAPALDPAWTGHGPVGEALLRPLPAAR